MCFIRIIFNMCVFSLYLYIENVEIRGIFSVVPRPL